MRIPFNSGRLQGKTVEGVSQLSILCGRILLFLACLLLAVMPITEHLWTFDKFLRGGPDLELGLFALVSILCLVAVLSRHRRQGVAILLAVRQLLSRYHHAEPGTLHTHLSEVRTTPANDSFLSISSLPLLI